MNLSLLILIPLLTAIAILFCKGLKQVRSVALFGAIVQLLTAFFLLSTYWQERATGNNTQMLFEYSHTWFAPLNINYHVGVDGISIAMILLTSFVVLGRCFGFMEDGEDEQRIFLPAYFIKSWSLWIFYFTRSFHAFLLS